MKGDQILASDLNEIRNDAQTAAQELLAVANLKPGQIVVVGCSSSEISGKKIDLLPVWKLPQQF